MNTFLAVLIIVAVVAVVLLAKKGMGAAADAAATSVNKNLLYKSEYKEGQEIVSAPLTVVVEASVLDVIHALNAHVTVAEHVPTAFKAVVYKSSGNAQRITYALGNKAVPTTFEAAVSFTNRGQTTEVVFEVLNWNENDGMIVGQDQLKRLRKQVEAALATLGSPAAEPVSPV